MPCCSNIKTIYLAGPIAGMNFDEANKWRVEVQSKLHKGIVGVNPLRCEPLMGESYQINMDKMWSIPGAISTKNWLDTESCDLVLAYLPKEFNDRRPSVGTIIEIGWAIGLRKPLIIISDDPAITKHPLITRNAGWVLDNLDDAVRVIHGLFDVYIEHDDLSSRPMDGEVYDLISESVQSRSLWPGKVYK